MAITYEYTFYRPGSAEEIAASFSTKSPLPHIQVGHFLIVESHDYSTTQGFHQVIRHIEMYLGFVVDPQEPTVRIWVFLEDCDRAETLRR